MSQSLSKLYVHIVFHTKYNQDLIKPQIENELYAYLGGILKENKCVPIAIDGIENHVHVLCIQSKNIALATLLEELKRNSSRWIKTKGAEYVDFAWQGGYGGFSVSQSKVDVVKRYIENQKEHHKTVSVKEEYLIFLQEYGVDYNEEYLWT
jgi:REP element-mobilizing transposase RayT